jgi:TRAP-type C4-dicarboxylate transport system permease small subunit
MTSVVDGFFGVLKAAMVLALALMVVLVFGNVVLRYGFNLGITVSEEMSRMLFVWLTFISAIVAMREHAHLGMDTLLKYLSPKGKKICFIASQLLMLYASWLFLQGSWKQTVISINVHATAPVTGMSMALFYGIGVLFSICAALLILADLYRAITGELTGDQLVMIKESAEESELQELNQELVDRDTDRQRREPQVAKKKP